MRAVMRWLADGNWAGGRLLLGGEMWGAMLVWAWALQRGWPPSHSAPVSSTSSCRC